MRTSVKQLRVKCVILISVLPSTPNGLKLHGNFPYSCHSATGFIFPVVLDCGDLSAAR